MERERGKIPGRLLNTKRGGGGRPGRLKTHETEGREKRGREGEGEDSFLIHSTPVKKLNSERSSLTSFIRTSAATSFCLK